MIVRTQNRKVKNQRAASRWDQKGKDEKAKGWETSDE
jgi:hypothetical protein